MVCEAYSATRSTLAKQFGLGNNRAAAEAVEPEPEPEKAETKASRGRPKKAA